MDFSNPNNLLIAAVYFLLVSVLAFFSLFGVYILIRYGRSTPLALAVSVTYGVIFIKILASTYLLLSSLLS